MLHPQAQLFPGNTFPLTWKKALLQVLKNTTEMFVVVWPTSRPFWKSATVWIRVTSLENSCQPKIDGTKPFVQFKGINHGPVQNSRQRGEEIAWPINVV